MKKTNGLTARMRAKMSVIFQLSDRTGGGGRLRWFGQRDEPASAVNCHRAYSLFAPTFKKWNR